MRTKDKVPMPPARALEDVARVFAKRTSRSGVDAVSADVLRSDGSYLKVARARYQSSHKTKVV